MLTAWNNHHQGAMTLLQDILNSTDPAQQQQQHKPNHCARALQAPSSSLQQGASDAMQKRRRSKTSKQPIHTSPVTINAPASIIKDDTQDTTTTILRSDLDIHKNNRDMFSNTTTDIVFPFDNNDDDNGDDDDDKRDTVDTNNIDATREPCNVTVTSWSTWDETTVASKTYDTKYCDGTAAAQETNDHQDMAWKELLQEPYSRISLDYLEIATNHHHHDNNEELDSNEPLSPSKISPRNRRHYYRTRNHWHCQLCLCSVPRQAEAQHCDGKGHASAFELIKLLVDEGTKEEVKNMERVVIPVSVGGNQRPVIRYACWLCHTSETDPAAASEPKPLTADDMIDHLQGPSHSLRLANLRCQSSTQTSAAREQKDNGNSNLSILVNKDDEANAERDVFADLSPLASSLGSPASDLNNELLSPSTSIDTDWKGLLQEPLHDIPLDYLEMTATETGSSSIVNHRESSWHCRLCLCNVRPDRELSHCAGKGHVHAYTLLQFLQGTQSTEREQVQRVRQNGQVRYICTLCETNQLSADYMLNHLNGKAHKNKVLDCHSLLSTEKMAVPTEQTTTNPQQSEFTVVETAEGTVRTLSVVETTSSADPSLMATPRVDVTLPVPLDEKSEHEVQTDSASSPSEELLASFNDDDESNDDTSAAHSESEQEAGMIGIQAWSTYGNEDDGSSQDDNAHMMGIQAWPAYSVPDDPAMTTLCSMVAMQSWRTSLAPQIGDIVTITTKHDGSSLMDMEFSPSSFRLGELSTIPEVPEFDSPPPKVRPQKETFVDCEEETDSSDNDSALLKARPCQEIPRIKFSVGAHQQDEAAALEDNDVSGINPNSQRALECLAALAFVA